ncbi:MAG: winged helix-turn-helix domain-containing protein [Gammaproteobacteria bacterium]
MAGSAPAIYVDLINQRLWRGEQEIKLTPKAFALLRYFVERPEQLISKDDLFNALWSDRYVNEELIRDYVRDLRKALGDDSDASRYIETLHRRGYRYRGGITVGEPPLVPPPRPVAVEANMAFPLPDKPSIVVLPFANFSGDPAQDFFIDGITESLITTLSKIPKLFVIARTSSFYYKGKTVTVKQVAEELGVRYVLEGSVRGSRERVRLTAQLIDALSGHHLWAEEYDGLRGDVFAFEDAITWKVATELEVQLIDGDGARLRRRETQNVEAYHCFLRGIALYDQFDKLSMQQAQRWLEEAVARDPNFASAWSWLGDTYRFLAAHFSSGADRASQLSRAVDYARKALAIDDKCSNAYFVLGAVHFYQGEHDKGAELLKKMVALQPSDSEKHAAYAFWLTYAGRPQEALVHIQQAMRLAPYYPAWYLLVIGMVHRNQGQYAEAIPIYEKYVEQCPHNPSIRCSLVGMYALTGRLGEAQASLAEVLNIEPEWTVARLIYAMPIKDLKVIQPILEALRGLGLPE